MSSPPKPASPPPAYTEIDPQSAGSSQTPAQPARIDGQFPAPAEFPSSPLPHPGYGPTNIIQQQTHLLPYYDPRSPYSMAEASARARWRFIGAFFWAILILGIVSLLMGVEVDIHNNPWNGDYWRRVVFGPGSTDAWRSS